METAQGSTSPSQGPTQPQPPPTVVVNSGGQSPWRNKKRVFLVLGLVVLFVGAIISALIITNPEFRSLIIPRAALPTIEFLGQSGTFSVGRGEFAIVKKAKPFRFETIPGPTSITVSGPERVWRCAGNDCNFLAELHTTVDFGQVEEGDTVEYVGIDDDQDNRRNTFLIDGEPVHIVEQGLVFSGSFTVEKNGRLSLQADDSIAAKINVSAPTPPPPPPPKVDLTLSKDVSGASSVDPGGETQFKITVTNESPEPVDATGVSVKDVFHQIMEVIEFETSKGTFTQAGEINSWIWNIGTMEPGEVQDLFISIRITSDESLLDFDTEYLNVAQIWTTDQEDIDSTPGNNETNLPEDDWDSALITVKKKEEPSPSPSPSPTPEPTDPPVGGPEPTPTPTAAPTLTPTPTPTPAPVSGPSSTATPEELPAAGIGSPTILGIGAGVMILLGVLLFAL